MMWIVYFLAVAVAGTVCAQDDEKLKPRLVSLKTKDGIELRAFYFPSDQGKDAITVLLVHEWQGQASPYKKLVLALRDAGCAVLVPDYRGHGGSRDYVNARGQKDQFNIAQMNKRDVESIIAFDLEKAKSFLKEENNEELLNLNALVVIGVREGCVMASHWAQRDWSFPSVGSMKQGQDVKALIFISPEKQIKGIGIDTAINQPTMYSLPVMIVAGASSPEASEARRLGKRIEGKKRRIGQGQASGFELRLVPTNLGGPSLVSEVSTVIPSIVNFIKNNVEITDDKNPWIERD
ncbi:MAG: alpha/beta hydrolase [Planctomycetota bacterium]